MKWKVERELLFKVLLEERKFTLDNAIAMKMPIKS